MHLKGRTGNAIDLRIANYQFAATGDRFDSNWLVLPPMNWSFRDPCLLTFEARELAVWLQDAANPLAEAATSR